MTVIDALVVEFGLDDSNFTPAQARAVKKLQDLEKAGAKAEQGNKKLTASTKEVAKSTENVTHVLTRLLTVIGGTVAIKAMIQDFIDTNAQLDRLSKNLELNVSDISAWSNAAERLGGSAAGLQGTFDMLSKSQTQLMLTGESSLIPFFSALGVSLADFQGKARPVTDILLDLSDHFSRMDRTTANNMGRMMGIDQGTMNLLLQGRKELELEIRRQKEQNAVTKAQAEEASKLQRGINDVRQGFAAFGRTLLMDAAPSLEKLFDMLTGFIHWAQENKEVIEDFLKVIAVGLGAIALATLPIDLTVVAVLALAAGIALLWQDYQTWKRGGDSLIDWGKWQPGIEGAIKGVTWLKDAIVGLFEAYTKLWERVTGHKWSDDFIAGVDAIKEAIGIKTPDYHPELRVKSAAGSKSSPTGSNLADFVLSHEGIRNQVYKDIAGKETIGIGHLVKPGEDFSKGITDAQAHDLLAQDLADARAAVDKYVKVALTSHQRDALTDFAFASGAGSLQKSTLLQKLNVGDYAGADAEFARWNHADVNGKMVEVPQLTRIRTAEANIFNAPDATGYAQALAGIPGAASMAASAPQGNGSGPSSLDKSVKTDIGTVIVNTQATDAKGIAEDVSHQAWDYLFASQANAGMN